MVPDGGDAAPRQGQGGVGEGGHCHRKGYSKAELLKSLILKSCSFNKRYPFFINIMFFSPVYLSYCSSERFISYSQNLTFICCVCCFKKVNSKLKFRN